MLPTTPAGQRGTRSASGRIGTVGAPSRRSALRAHQRTVPDSRRRSATAPATMAASTGNIADSGASQNSTAHADLGTTASINAQPPCEDRAASDGDTGTLTQRTVPAPDEATVRPG